jgi:shikimate dehydrogenase
MSTLKKQSFVLFGHPVRHSISAPMFTAAFRAIGVPHTYSPVDVAKPEALGRAVSFVRDGIYDGANVTLPYKQRVLDHVDAVDATAQRVGAANVLVREARGVVAYNTDAPALADEIASVTQGRSRAAIIGAGGASLAALAACKSLGFSVIGVTTRSWVDTEAMLAASSATRVRGAGGMASVWPRLEKHPPTTRMSMAMRMQWTELAVLAEVVIQATSAGMHGADPGDEIAAMVPFANMPKSTVAIDLVYRPEETPFLARARATGLIAVGGLGMLVRQAEASFRLWTKEAPPPGVMREAAERVLALTAVPS